MSAFRILFTLALTVAVAFWANATEFEQSHFLPKLEFQVGNTVRLLDATEVAELLNPNEYVASRTNRVQLVYSRDEQTDIAENGFWQLTIGYDIYPTDDPSAPESGTLTVRFEPGDDVYEHYALHQLGGDVTVEITSVTAHWKQTVNEPWGPVASPYNAMSIPNDIRLELITETERFERVETTFTTTVGFDATASEIYWGYVPGAEAYEVEWVFIDEYDDGFWNAPPGTPEGPFEHKDPVTLVTSNHRHQLDLTYPEGQLFFRVRPVGRFIANVGTDYTHAKYGAFSYWSDIAQSQLTSYLIEPGNAFEADKLWQYSTTFAEEGKHKSVISYMDGSSRSRQAITNLSTDENSLVAESRYDQEGRPAASIMPVPIAGVSMSYVPNVNMAIGGVDEWSAQHFEQGGTPTPMAATSGAAQYYSASNPFLASNPYAASIPNMNGYTFATTEYTRDNTGRVNRTGGVGQKHQIGSTTAGTYDTKVYYGTPSSTELHRLFGSNVGKASHYKKLVTLDPNGQFAASYIDQEGRTIATALIGDGLSTDDPLIALDYTPEQVTVNLNDNNVLNMGAERSQSINHLMNAIPGTTYDFKYDMTGTFLTSGGVCLGCQYVLEIRITDPDGLPVQINSSDVYVQPLEEAPDCNQSGFTIPTITLPPITLQKIGEHTVEKILWLQDPLTDPDALLDAAGLDETYLQNLITTYQSQIDESDCDLTCEDHCRTLHEEAGLTGQALEDAVAICVAETCGQSVDVESLQEEICDGYLQQMLTDVSPSPDDDAFPDGWLYADDAFLWAHVGDLPTVHPAYSNAGAIRADWQESYADIYVLHHREYCHYESCTSNVAARAYNVDMTQVSDWPEGISTGYLNPIGLNNNDIEGGAWAIATPTLDPFVVGNTAHFNAMEDAMQDYFGSQSIWDRAQNPGFSINDAITEAANNGITITADELKWQLFMSAYVDAKEGVINQELETAGCAYQTDANTIVQAPLNITSGDAMYTWMEDNFPDPVDGCANMCDNNVSTWMWQLDDACDLNSTQSQATLAGIESELSAFCTGPDGCSDDNPFGLILSTYTTEVQGIVDELVGTGCTIADIAVPSPYTTTVSTPDPYFKYMSHFTNGVVPFLNSQVLPWLATNARNTSNGTCNSFGDQDFLWSSEPVAGAILENHYQAFDPDLDRFRMSYSQGLTYDDNSAATPPYSACYAFMDATGASVDMCAVNEILGVYPLDVNDPNNPLSTNASVYYVEFWDQSHGLLYWDLDEQDTGTPPTLCDNAVSVDATLSTPGFTSTIPTVTVDYTQVHNDCVDQLLAEAEQNAIDDFNDQVDAFLSSVLNDYATCLPVSENFRVSYLDKEHHYTLYYYDQAGSLVQTVPPAGVDRLDVNGAAFDSDGVYDATTQPQHTLKTQYRYNSLGELVWQSTPDGGETNFWYDTKGRLVASQNAQQAVDVLQDDAMNQYRPHSYTRYDNLSRIAEVGEVFVPVSQSLISLTQAEQDVILNDPNWPRDVTDDAILVWEPYRHSEVTSTIYDAPLTASIDAEFGTAGQQHLRNRVATITYEDIDDADAATYDHATHYSYDEHGNVHTLLQDNTHLAWLEQDIKRIQYEYDLLSGNVHMVSYQPGERDAFYHRYAYDADNRLTIAETSSDAVRWRRDAKYFYHLHGPLARKEVGHDKVQGCDYAYTGHGWLKGVNAEMLVASRDLGQDGNTGATNALVAKDAMGFALHYYADDYTSIGTTSFLTGLNAAGSSGQTDLYNGNIAAMTTALSKLDASPHDVLQNHYRYDQLNRLKESNANTLDYDVDPLATHSLTSTTDYHVALTYDGNGNIETLTRNGHAAQQTTMDQFTYSYLSGSNKLDHVADAVTGSVYADDLESQGTGNYDYDNIGNLIQDDAEEIFQIDWTVYGKVARVIRDWQSGKPDLEFRYDAAGNRIAKTVKPRTGSGLNSEDQWTTTYYACDAQGNIMATYELSYEDATNGYYANVSRTEANLFGSQRLGINHTNIDVMKLGFTATIDGTTQEFDNLQVSGQATLTTLTPEQYQPGFVTYELSNHLGNVLSTVSDKKVGDQQAVASTGMLELTPITDGLSISGTSLVKDPGLPSGWDVADGSAKEYLDGPGGVVSWEIPANYASGYGALVGLDASQDNLDGFLADYCMVASSQFAIYESGSTNSPNPVPPAPQAGDVLRMEWTTGNVINYQINGTTYATSNVMNPAPSKLYVVFSIWGVGSQVDNVTVTNGYQEEFVNYAADVTSFSDYYPFGMKMPNRNQSTTSYRYGFNGMEGDEEVAGNGNAYTTFFRSYDPRIARWTSIDPVFHEWQSPYTAFDNSPISIVDPSGADGKLIGQEEANAGGGEVGDHYVDQNGQRFAKTDLGWILESAGSESGNRSMSLDGFLSALRALDASLKGTTDMQFGVEIAHSGGVSGEAHIVRKDNYDSVVDVPEDLWEYLNYRATGLSMMSKVSIKTGSTKEVETVSFTTVRAREIKPKPPTFYEWKRLQGDRYKGLGKGWAKQAWKDYYKELEMNYAPTVLATYNSKTNVVSMRLSWEYKPTIAKPDAHDVIGLAMSMESALYDLLTPDYTVKSVTADTLIPNKAGTLNARGHSPIIYEAFDSLIWNEGGSVIPTVHPK